MVAVHPDHRLARCRRISWADLRGEVLLLHPPAEGDRQWFCRAAQVEQASAGPREVRRVPLTEAILELARAGCGVALLTRLATDQACREGKIRRIPFAPRRLVREFVGVSRKSNPRDLPIAAFSALIRQHCRSEALFRAS